MTEEITPTYLAVKWTVSRGRETYGYNICTVTDQETGKRFRCMGGGYDMLGTSFGEWMQETYQARLIAIAERAHTVGYSPSEWTHDGELYGMAWYQYGGGRVNLDGGCGIESMVKIAKEIGLHLSRTWDRRGNTTGYVVTSAIQS